jgi:hypothetical protein
MVEACIDLAVPGRPIRSLVAEDRPEWAPGLPARTPMTPGRVTAAPDDRIGLAEQIAADCCPRRAIRGRSMAERASDLGWS